jgi:hypothetical protein
MSYVLVYVSSVRLFLDIEMKRQREGRGGHEKTGSLTKVLCWPKFGAESGQDAELDSCLA